MIKEYSGLHSHSHFSVFDGLSKPEELLQAAKDKGLKSVALTDHGNTNGHSDFYIHGKRLGVRTIFGVEAYVIHSLTEWADLKAKIDAERVAKKGRRKEEGASFADDGDVVDDKQLRRKGHLVILATSQEGLSNLYRLVFKAHKHGFYSKPRMDKDMLREHARGLVATSACMGGVVAKRLWDLKAGDATWEDVRQEALEFDAIFGRGRFYLEIQLNEMDEQNFINEGLVKLHQETGIPLTVTTDSHYSKPEEWEPREILHMLGWSKKTIAQLPGGKIDTQIKQLYVKNPEEMWQTYLAYGAHKIDERTMLSAFEGPLVIDSLAGDFEPDTHLRLPTLPYADPLREMGIRAIAGLKRLGLAERDEYRQRLLTELAVIRDKGFAGYFLVVQQVIEEAKKHMLVGPGRGSSAGSLVCYCLGITDLDPLPRTLLFERFLDINRAEYPDIDIDFQEPAEAKKMLSGMYGDDNVASLTSYGTFQIKGLLKDLGRVYGLDHNDVNKVNRGIERDLRTLKQEVVERDLEWSSYALTVDEIDRVSPTFRKFVAANPELGGQIKKLYGRVRHVSRHAAGVVIGDDLPAETSVFTATDKDTGEKIVQASFTEGVVGKNASAMGFIKFDVLSLASLRVIDLAMRLIEARTGQSYDEQREALRPHRLDMTDKKVFDQVFWQSNFEGIFQFTNHGIRNLAKRVKPDTFDDVSAIVSLYRPGPLKGGYDKLYVNNKHNPQDIAYDHPLLESILKRTHGCLVFQEQLMLICRDLGKMDGKDVNRARKILFKKDKSKSDDFIEKERADLKAKFLAGCAENGMEQEKAEALLGNMIAFGSYAFNQAHSDAYSVVTMQTAHLATYYPLEFYTAVLTRAQATHKQAVVSGVKRRGIPILQVDVNASKMANVVDGDAIRMSFLNVLGVGAASVEKITAAQPYSSFIDFLERSKASRTAISPLILVGAFAALPDCQNIKALEAFYDKYCETTRLKNKKNSELLKTVFMEMTGGTLATPVPADYQEHEKVFFENQLMGFSLTGSPFEILGRPDKATALRDAGVFRGYDEFVKSDDETGVLLCELKAFKERPQKNGQLFAFISLATETGEEFEAPAFSAIWKYAKQKIKTNNVYLVTVSRDIDDPERFKIGRPGFAHSGHSASGYFVDLDEISL